MLIVFIDHIAKSIQLPQVIASIAGDLSRAIDDSSSAPDPVALRAGPSISEMLRRLDESGDLVRARAADTCSSCGSTRCSASRPAHTP